MQDDIFVDTSNATDAVGVLRNLADRIENGELTLISGGILLTDYPATNTLGLASNVHFAVKKVD